MGWGVRGGGGAGWAGGGGGQVGTSERWLCALMRPLPGDLLEAIRSAGAATLILSTVRVMQAQAPAAGAGGVCGGDAAGAGRGAGWGAEEEEEAVEAPWLAGEGAWFDDGATEEAYRDAGYSVVRARTHTHAHARTHTHARTPARPPAGNRPDWPAGRQAG